MTRVTNQPAAGDIHKAAEAVLAHYQSAAAVETERAIAMLALWALDAIEGGRLSPLDADEIFTLIDTEISETSGGPELSEDVAQILIEGMALHDWGTEFSSDVLRMRALALSLLHTTA